MQPIVICLVAYIVGMLSGSFLDSGASLTFLWTTPFVFAALWLFFRRRHPAVFSLLLLIFFSVGLVRVPLSLNPPVDTTQVYLFSGPSPVVIEGTVLQVAPRGLEQSSVDLEAHLVSSRGIATAVSGRVRLYIDSKQPGLLYGDRIRFRSRLRRPRAFGTPGEFDMPRHLAYSDIWVTAYLSDTEALVRFAGGKHGVLRQIAQLRQRCGEVIDQAVSSDLAPFVRALALGERGAIPLEQRKELARGGVAHLFAISGLHMGLLALFGYQLLLFGYRRSPRLLRWHPPQRILPLILLPLLFGYLLLTGDALSTRRAFAACLCAALFLLWRRRVAPLPMLATLALIFLLLEPLALWQASFQMSFAGVAGILCWRRYWQLKGFKLPWAIKKMTQVFLISLAAIVATTPLVVLNFHLFAPAGLLNNLFAIPLVTLLAVPAGLAGIGLTICWPPLAEAAFYFCGQILKVTIQLTGKINSLPGLDGDLFYLTRWQIVVLSGVSLLFLIPWKRLLSPALILPILITLFYLPTGTEGEGLMLTAFSVGQGESMLLSIDSKKQILIDGGGLYSDSFDVGERLLAPALGYLGVKKLDAVLLSHAHPDHSKGLVYLLETVPVDSFWCGIDPQALPVNLRQVLLERQIPIRQFPQGWSSVSISDADKLNLYVPELEHGSKNDRSVALYISRGEDGLLMTGDLESAGTAVLLDAGLPGPVNLLKLPHHGSRHSGAQRLLEQLRPQKVLASVGYKNHYRFPAPEVVSDILKYEAELYRTDLSGTIRFCSHGRGWQVDQWGNGLFR